MNQTLLKRFLPYLIAGVLIVFCLVALVVLWWVFVWGILLGMVLLAVNLIRNKIRQLRGQQPIENFKHTEPRQGVTIEHDAGEK